MVFVFLKIFFVVCEVEVKAGKKKKNREDIKKFLACIKQGVPRCF